MTIELTKNEAQNLLSILNTELARDHEGLIERNITKQDRAFYKARQKKAVNLFNKISDAHRLQN